MKSFIEVSIIKNYPTSNLNRDMSGTPKTTYFGDVQRGRISSQCLKRNIRKSIFMQDAFGKESVGERTRRLDVLVMEELSNRGDFSTYEKDIRELVNKVGKKSDDSKDVIQLYSHGDVSFIADVIEKAIQNGNKIKDIKLEKELEENVRPISLDIAFFGRMSTNKSFSTVEGASQVAHAFTTHKVKLENDWFTAIDDVVARLEGEQGSGHLGDFELDSGCFYEYMNLDIEQIKKNLKNNNITEDELYKGIKQYILATCLTNPTGKQNSCAAFSYPSLVMVELKDKKVALNYANAFVTPIKNTAEGNIVENSISALSNYVDKCDGMYKLCNKRFWINLDGNKENHPVEAEIYSNLEKAIEDIIVEIKGE